MLGLSLAEETPLVSQEEAVSGSVLAEETPLDSGDEDNDSDDKKCITWEELIEQSQESLPDKLFSQLHYNPDADVQPCNTAAACKNRVTFNNLKVHRIFGCQHFKQPHLVAAASENARLIHTGELPPTLGAFAIMTNPPRGKSIRKRQKYSQKFHMDIVFGDYVALGGFRYASLLVNVATRYCWVYGVTSIKSGAVVDALNHFRVEAGGVSKKFHANFDKKLIGGKALGVYLNLGRAMNHGRLFRSPQAPMSA